MKIIFPFLLILLPLNLQEESSIVWDPANKLVWEKFKGTPENNTDAAATTVSALSYNFRGYVKGGQLIYEYDVKALFFPEKSWVRAGLKDEELLLHEQLHFDITAWYAAKLRRAFDTITPVADPRDAIEQVYETLRVELDSMQELYDRETDFSRNTKEQLLWRSRVKSYLAKEYE